jgi:hypothetical protein
VGNISLKRVVADTIANYLAANVTGLAGKVSAVPAGPETNAPCLAVKVLPDTLRFEPSQADERYEDDPDDGKLVLDVGSFTGIYTIQLFAASVVERELYEQRIMDLFLKDPWASGTIFVTTPNLTINGYASLYKAELKARLDSEEWNEEFAMESRRYSFLELFIDFPALTAINATNITSLQVCLADINSIVVSISDIDESDRVEVLADGSVEKGTV